MHAPMTTTPSHRLDDLLQRKQALLDTGKRLRELAATGGDPNSAQVLDDFLARFRDTRFLVLVVGDFKSGKSTLVNALIGKKLCPVRATPRTAKVTRICSTNDPKGAEEVEIAYLLDRPKERRALSETSLDDLVAVKGATTDSVQLVDVFMNPSDTLLRFPLRLVDTPGLGSIEKEHTATTRDYVQHADVIVFVISASKAMTEAERAFLLLNRTLLARTIFVVNQIDRVEGEEDEVLRYVSEGLVREVLPPDAPKPNLYPVSGQKALEAAPASESSGVPRLVEAIEQHLAERPFAELLKTICEQQTQVCGALRAQTSLAMGAHETASQSADALLPALDSLRHELMRFNTEHVATRINATNSVEQLHAQVPALTDQLRRLVSERIKSWVNACKTEDDCKRGLPAFLALDLTNAVEQLNREFSARTAVISEAALGDLSRIFNKMEVRTRAVLTRGTPVDVGGFGRGVAALSGLSAFAEHMGGPQGGYGAATAAMSAALGPSPEVRLLSIGAALSLIIAALGGPVSWLFAGLTSVLATFFGWRHSSSWRERVVERVIEKLDRETLPSVTAALQESLANFATTLSDEIVSRSNAVLNRLLLVVDQVTTELQRGRAERDAERARLAIQLEELDRVAAELVTFAVEKSAAK